MTDAASTDRRTRIAGDVRATHRVLRLSAGLNARVDRTLDARTIGQATSDARFTAGWRLTGIAEAIRAIALVIPAKLCADFRGFLDARCAARCRHTARPDGRTAATIDVFARNTGNGFSAASEALFDG